MKPVTYNSPIVEFLATQNTVKVNNKKEFDDLKCLVAMIGVDLDRYCTWDQIQRNSNFNGYACIEYDNRKGTTYYTDEEDSIEWYGVDPISMEELCA